MNRKSFVLHLDSLDVLDELTDDQAGKLFKAIHKHQKGEFVELCQVLKIAFTPLKNQFARDNEKYKRIVERNKNNGLKGGRPITQANPNKPTGLSGNPSKPKKADSVNDSVNDSDSDSDNDSKKEKQQERFCFFWKLYPNKSSKQQALKAFNTKVKSADNYNDVVNGLKNQIEWRLKNKNEFIPNWKNASTWLNNKCWEDELTVFVNKPKGNARVEDFKNTNYGQAEVRF